MSDIFGEGRGSVTVGDVVRLRRWTSPVGELLLGECRGMICLCDWAGGERRKRIDGRISRKLGARYEFKRSELTDRLVRQLEEYFAGERRSFDLPLAMAGTEFQKRVWEALLEIPYGEVISYGSLACRLGTPGAVRAVARAVGDNAMSIIVPCHRVVGSDGGLTGYAGGLTAKQSLLALEQGISR